MTDRPDTTRPGDAADAAAPPPARHPFDAGTLLAGLFFLSAAGVFLAGGLSGGSVMGMTALVPTVLIGLGVVGILRIVTRSRRR